MKEKILLSTTGNVTGDTVGWDKTRYPEAVAVFTVTGAGTLQIQGKFVSDATYVNLHTAQTATGVLIITTMPLMRAVSSGVSGGVVRVTIGA